MARVGASDMEEVESHGEASRKEGIRVGLSVATIGCASLSAWNAVITASGYYAKRFCGGRLHHSFESVFSLTYQATSMFATVYAMHVAEALPAEQRMVPGLKALTALFCGFAALACVPDVPRDSVFTPLTLAGVAACGLLSQAVCSALYGLAVALPPRFVSWNMAGQAVGGLIPALIVVMTTLAVSDDDDDCGTSTIDLSAAGYFGTSALLFALAVCAFRTLQTTRAYRECVSGPAAKRLDDSEVPLVASSHDNDDGLATTVRRVAVPSAAVFFTFVVTLAVFPPLTALARPNGHDDDDDASLFQRLYVPLLFLEFNLGDFLGRSASSVCRDLALRPAILLAVSLLRIAFLPLFALGNLQGSHHDHLKPTAFLRATPAPFVVMAFFAVSHGLNAALSMAAGAPLVDKAHRELAGTVLCFFLTLGLVSGSALSFAMLALV